MPDAELVLCLNAGSSSLKFALFRCENQNETQLASGTVERLGTAEARAVLHSPGEPVTEACPNATPQQALDAAFTLLDSRGLPPATLVGHRIVHGGRAHLQATRVDATLLAELKQLIPLAPLHLPAGISGIESALARLPHVPHVACFDTSFHAHLPDYAARFPLPNRLYDEGIRRYGFHGLSYEYVLSTLGNPPPSRVIIAHLGNGASLAAIQDGRSVDTTMGFTPAGGILMGTRAGDLDPGLVLYLLREKGFSSETLETLLNHESGLLGVGGSADVRTLTERRDRDHDPQATLALSMLGYAVRKVIGSYLAVLGGLDALVFTGGIGEHSAAVREEACCGLSPLGIELDPAQNAANAREIQRAGSCSVLVVPTDEDRMIARHARALVHPA